MSFSFSHLTSISFGVECIWSCSGAFELVPSVLSFWTPNSNVHCSQFCANSVRVWISYHLRLQFHNFHTAVLRYLRTALIQISHQVYVLILSLKSITHHHGHLLISFIIVKEFCCSVAVTLRRWGTWGWINFLFWVLFFLPFRSKWALILISNLPTFPIITQCTEKSLVCTWEVVLRIRGACKTRCCLIDRVVQWSTIIHWLSDLIRLFIWVNSILCDAVIGIVVIGEGGFTIKVIRFLIAFWCSVFVVTKHGWTLIRIWHFSAGRPFTLWSLEIVMFAR